ncbi:MAG: hypothetical protein O7C03_01625 [Gammaproteobacteria bacterium]|nr:hypothetical protein [Gammaproteobacteria bacterium]MCZ6686400.1 hypothetical protein [Gammaproteobacteria bacterium]MCZ6761679.1 hypothetical protein [Gammaproteobacteria bacterium]
MQESIVRYNRYRYLWVALGLCAAAVLAYALQDPQEPPNGGTALGYTLGTLGALLIVWLAWFGVRKRQYSSTAGTVQGWLSAHVYLGLALILVVLLHSGFQFGMNVHTLALVLMILVVLSGIFGVYMYIKYPLRLNENRQGAGRSDLVDQIDDIDRRAKRVAGGLPRGYGELIHSGINRTVVGGSAWAMIAGRDNSQVVLPTGDDYTVVANPGQEAALDWLAEQQSRSMDAETAAKMTELSGLLRNKRKLLERLREDIRLQAMLEVWLYIHVPLSVGLLAAVVVHIITVFLYW